MGVAGITDRPILTRSSAPDQRGEVWPRATVPLAAGRHRRIARHSLEPVCESVAAARGFTRETLSSWGMARLAQNAVLIVSELVTNALLHAAGCEPGSPGRGIVEVIWWHRADHLLCVVIDPSTQPPVLASDDLASDSGRGLRVIQAVASAWGWIALNSREKAVWATISD
jgi:two-component sensor histidine kinase